MIASLALSSLGLITGWLLFWRLSGSDLPMPQADTSKTQLDSISIVVPARNEERNLPQLLNSLKLQGPEELIVVDDHSTDQTARLATEAGARVLGSAELAQGWTGKNFACAQGANAATQNWLLFLDADTTFEPNGLARLRTLLRSPEDTALSILPYHVTRKPYEELSLFFNLLMAAGTGGFGLFSRAKLFGQTLLISRKLYTESGGHGAVRGRILENFSMAEKILNASGRCQCYRGQGTIRMRMYSAGIGQLAQGWTKAFAAGASGSSRLTLLLSIVWLSALFSTFTWLLVGPERLLAALFYLALAVQLAYFGRQLGSFRAYSFALYPIPLTFFFILFGRALVLRSLGRKTTWSGRKL